MTAKVAPRQVVELRARLEEAEATLGAIRSGAIDALVVGAPGDEQIYTLTGADRSMRELAEHMSDGAATLTADGTIVWANRRLAEILGVPSRRLLGVSLVGLVDAAHRDAVATLLGGAGPDVRDAELDLARPDGSTVPVRIAAFSVTVGGEAGLAIVLTDLTQQRDIERILRRSAAELEGLVRQRTLQLEQTTKELEAFTYSVSHDLRAPLRAIRAFSQILLEEHAERLDEEGKRVLGVVVRNTNQMGALINDLLTLSRVAHVELALRQVNMQRLARQVADELQAVDPTRRVDMRVGALCDAIGEPALLRQVWANLIGNALKFTRLRPDARVEIRCERGDGECRYIVADNGVGFEPAYASEVFFPFRRLHATSEFEGTGIGLAIVSRIVARHGGRVWAEAVPGAGATIGFALPERSSERDVTSA